jgi:hypothetical protein|tara:strand:+ start:770 stop:985 length:216 start_codon:yes stop_codon:yes gene_type:complete
MKTKYLEIHDLSNVITLIDGAAKQGLFAGDQLALIGAMRQKFVSELKEQAPAENNVAHLENEEPKVEVSSE